jgi:CHAD domain-containing protein
MLENTNDTITTEDEKSQIVKENDKVEQTDNIEKKEKQTQEEFKLIEYLKSTISERLDDFLQYHPMVMEDNHPKVSHKMRVAGKKLRYTLEAFEDNNLFAEPIQHLKQAQDHLGYMHDLYTHSKYFDKMFKKSKNKKVKRAITEIKEFLNQEYQNKYAQMNEAVKVETITDDVKRDMDKLDNFFSDEDNIFQNQIYHKYSAHRHGIIKHVKMNIPKKSKMKKGVHKSRVTARRMNAILQLYPRIYNDKEQKKAEKLLSKGIERKLGNTRELQVLKSFLNDYKQSQTDKKPINMIISRIDKKIKSRKSKVVKKAKKLKLDKLDLKPLE